MTTTAQIQDWLKSIRDVIDINTDGVDIDSIQGKLHRVASLIGLSAEAKSKARGVLERARLIALSKIQKDESKLGATLMSKQMDAMCAEELELYEYADRINAGLTHELDALRTVISLYKVELENSMKTV